MTTKTAKMFCRLLVDEHRKQARTLPAWLGGRQLFPMQGKAYVAFLKTQVIAQPTAIGFAYKLALREIGA